MSFCSCDNHTPVECPVTSLFLQPPGRKPRPQSSSLVFSSWSLFTVDHPAPIHVKEVHMYHFTVLSNFRGCPALPSPASLTHHPWIPLNTSSCGCKVQNKVQSCRFPEHFLNLGRFCFLTEVVMLAQRSSPTGLYRLECVLG